MGIMGNQRSDEPPYELLSHVGDYNWTWIDKNVGSSLPVSDENIFFHNILFKRFKIQQNHTGTWISPYRQ